MLRRMRRGPVVWHPDDEDHRGEKCISKPKTTPYPQRSDGAGGWNQEFRCASPRRKKVDAEESGQHSHAKKANRTCCQRFLDPVAVETSARNGEFGGRIG